MEIAPAHLTYLTQPRRQGEGGGALLSPDRQTVIGSMLILEGDSEAEIEAMLAQRPLWAGRPVRRHRHQTVRQAVGVPLS